TIMAPDVWVRVGAIPFTDKGYTARGSLWGLVGGRVKPGVSFKQGGGDLDASARALERDYTRAKGGNRLRVASSSPIAAGRRLCTDRKRTSCRRSKMKRKARRTGYGCEARSSSRRSHSAFCSWWYRACSCERSNVLVRLIRGSIRTASRSPLSTCQSRAIRVR